MAQDYIPLGAMADRGAAMLEIRCGRCERHGCLSVKRLLARYGPDAAMGPIMHEQISSCPHRNDTQIYTPSAIRIVLYARAALFPVPL